MAKRISKVTFTSNPLGISSQNEKYYIDDILQLKALGADDLIQLNTKYKDGAVANGVIGVKQGKLMGGADDRIALPCPPYCHPSTEGVPREIGDLTFQEALEKIKI